MGKRKSENTKEEVRRMNQERKKRKSHKEREILSALLSEAELFERQQQNFCDTSPKYLNRFNSLHRRKKAAMKKSIVAESKAQRKYLEAISSNGWNNYKNKERLGTLKRKKGRDNLFCRACNLYFDSPHNKRGHMSGKKHLAVISSQMARAGRENKTKSKWDDVDRTLQSYKKSHPSVYLYLLKTAKLVRSLRHFSACGQLATKRAVWKVDSLSQIFWRTPDEPRRAIVVVFLIDVDVPKLLTEVLRLLCQKYSNVFSSEEQTNSEVNLATAEILAISAAILNFSDLHDKFCEACGEAGLVEECLKLLRGVKMCTHDFSDTWTILNGPEGTDDRFSEVGTIGFIVLGVLHNMLKSLKTNEYFDSCGAVEILLSFYRTQFPEYRMAALLCLAYLVDEKNNHLIMATEEPINYLLELLKDACNCDDRRSLGYSAAEIAHGLSYVATNDENKKMIGKLGGISVLAAMLQDETYLPERSASVRALYMLSFDEENKDIIRTDSGIMDLLQNLQHSGDKEIQLAASGVIWEIAGKEEHKNTSTQSSDSEAHIMISYHWGCQKTMLQVKKELESKGLRVWMDVDKMTGDTLETMARAVEKSSLVLIAMSRGYQSSPNCRSEAEYAYTRRKQIIPLMMEENYKPDGWLGIILGSKLYMNFKEGTHKGIQELLKEIKNVRAVSAQSAVSGQSEAPSPMQEGNKRFLSWQKKDVAKWLKSIGFDVGENEVRGKLDGRELDRLDNLRKEVSLVTTIFSLS
ncbi:PREDICTED: uncharacterized protein LOC107357901 [Acropora digitifera]|uniref:uncharacterized protein LOC107357901 n=1 Tax=Acropora digitifera TaxID=70779 RepID=UPI00077AA457|nr:PREDICTED: uncharacterized protein LOC107357901 [Acropora digitifera]